MYGQVVYITPMNKAARFEMRMDPHLRRWLSEYASLCGRPESQVVRDLLIALREGRLFMRPRSSPNPFPANEIPAGETPDYPILVTQDGENHS